MDKSAMRFLFGDRELVLTVGTLLTAQTEAVLIPALPDLSHQPGLSQEVTQRAGEQVCQELAQLIREYGRIDYGMAVYTSAGDLPFRSIIHAITPEVDSNDPRRLLEQALLRSLQLCDLNEWQSLACPVMELAATALTLDDLAAAYFHVITHFWDARQECGLEKVVIYTSQDEFRPFFDAFREQGFNNEDENAVQKPASAASNEEIGEIELSEDEITSQDNSDIDSWFK